MLPHSSSSLGSLGLQSRPGLLVGLALHQSDAALYIPQRALDVALDPPLPRYLAGFALLDAVSSVQELAANLDAQAVAFLPVVADLRSESFKGRAGVVTRLHCSVLP